MKSKELWQEKNYIRVKNGEKLEQLSVGKAHHPPLARYIIINIHLLCHL